jgi:hypothetical protein
MNGVVGILAFAICSIKDAVLVLILSPKSYLLAKISPIK